MPSRTETLASKSALEWHFGHCSSLISGVHSWMRSAWNTPDVIIVFHMNAFRSVELPSVMVQPPFFPFSSLSVPHPISITFRLHLPLSTCLPLPPLQLQGVLMQLCYVHAQTSLGLTSDLLRPDPCTKGYHLYTSYNLSDPFFIINNG